ncbi:MAG: alginate O-acetyltransferase AlgX-related protein, partial [bacterium]
RADVTRRGQRFAVVYFPERRQVLKESWSQALKCWPKASALAWDLDKPNRSLEAFLRHEGVSYLDLTPHFRNYVAKTGHTIFFSRDWHIDAEGHRLAARLVNEWLLSEHLVPRPGKPR